MRIGAVIFKGFRIALGIAVCAGLVYALGAFRGGIAWSLGMAVLCSGTALMMHRQPVGTVGFSNYLAGFTLPWGYRIGRGKLLPIIATSWVIWMLLGVAVIAATNQILRKCTDGGG